MVDGVGNTAYSYTALGQLESEDGPWASDTVSYTYNNRLRDSLSVAAPNASAWTQSYAYDAARRLTNITSPAGTFGYAYNVAQVVSPASLIRKLSLPGGSYVTNSYDSVARLLSTKLKNSGGSVLNSHDYGYNVSNQRTYQTNLAGNYWGYTYDGIGQLKTANGKESGGSPNRLHEQLGYTYDAAGNLNYRTNNDLVQTFTVNTLNELSSVSRSSSMTVAGTTTSEATSVTVNTLTADLYEDNTFARAGFTATNGWNSYTAVAEDSYGRSDTNSVTVNLLVTNSFIYDLNGNLRTNGSRVFDYDDENRLVEIREPGAWKAEFVYDGRDRRRIQRDYGWSGSAWVLTNETRLVYDGNLPIQHRHANNLPALTLTRGRDLSGSFQGAGGIGGLLAMTENSTLNSESSSAHGYYHADGNGNVTCLINTNQQIVAGYSFDPFGNTLAISGPQAFVNPYRFSSKPIHKMSGMYDYLYRYYDPNLQRWPNRDPLEEKYDINLYRYVYNSPLNYVDLDGLWGIQFGDFNIGWGDPNLAFDWDSWNDLGEGAAATADGLIPFFDPFKDKYDPCDPIFAYSYAGGEIAQNALLTAAGLRAAAWLGGTRLGHGLNHNRYLRIGPGRMPRNGPHPPSTGAPRISVGPQRPGVQNPHRDLRLWPLD